MTSGRLMAARAWRAIRAFAGRLFETGAIVLHIAERHAGMRDPDVAHGSIWVVPRSRERWCSASAMITGLAVSRTRGGPKLVER